MNDKSPGNQGLWRAGAVLITVAVAALATGCSVATSTQYPSGVAGSVTHQQVVAFVQCVRSRGALDFSVPPPGEHRALTLPPDGTGPDAKAIDACRHLLPRGREITSISVG
jgi:hypothetical protein